MQKQPIKYNIMTSFLFSTSVMLYCLGYAFQDPATPLMEGIIALHSDIWAIMLFVAGFVVYMLCSALRQFHSATTEYTYKVHHNSFIEIVWTTIQHYFFVL
jgi:heme/copper-type cytochrome/quinol oxidase subunit 2